MRFLQSDSSLSPSEKEEKEVERLIGRKPAPSRKSAPRKGPKFDNRRKRMKTDDSDTKSGDKDLSMKNSSLADLALRVFISTTIAADEPDKFEDILKYPGRIHDNESFEYKYKYVVDKLEKLDPEKLKLFKNTYDIPFGKYIKEKKWDIIDFELGKALSYIKKEEKSKKSPEEILEEKVENKKDISKKKKDLFFKFKRVSPKLAEEFENTELNEEKLDEIKSDALDGKLRNKLSKTNDVGEILSLVERRWPEGSSLSFGIKYNILNALNDRIEDMGDSIPTWLYASFFKTSPDVEELHNKIIENSEHGSDSFNKIRPGDLLTFATIASLFQKLSKNPNVDAKNLSLKKDIDVVRKQIESESELISDTQAFMKAWDQAAEQFKTHEGKEGWKWDDGHGKLLKSVESLFNLKNEEKKSEVDPFLLMENFRDKITKKYGKLPKEAENMYNGLMRKSKQASNKASVSGPMSVKTATFHGLVEQGHPSGPTNTGYKSYHKRYFGKPQYESILKFAKELLDEDWFKYGWDDGSIDAQQRAALDISIQTGDDNLYQSKIDAETYDMLLNRLAGWGHDSFSETVFPVEKGSRRSASIMQNQIKNILRIASDIRNDNPKAAFEIVKNLRSLVGRTAEDQQQGQQQEQQGQQQEQQGGKNIKDKKDSGFNREDEEILDETEQNVFKGGEHNPQKTINDLKEALDSLDIDDFVSAFEELGSLADFLKKNKGKKEASVNHKIAIMEALEGLEDISEDEIEKAFKNMQKVLKDDIDDPKDIDSEDIEKLIKDMIDQLSKDVKPSSKEASEATVGVGVLIRLAHNNPGIRRVLLPVILAAKKKPSKKKKPVPPAFLKGKKDKKEEDKNKPKTSKKKKKKKVSSVILTKEDGNW